MNVQIIQGGQVLRSYAHNGRFYAEAPPQGAYEIRLTNNQSRNRLAVVSVDGVNVITGEDASVDGPGYVMRPHEALTIPGWRRDGEKVAKFTFQKQEASYANRTGRGTKNTGVIGVAVYDEKVKPLLNVLRSCDLTPGGKVDDDTLCSTWGLTFGDGVGDGVTVTNAVMDSGEVTCSAGPDSGRARKVPASKRVGGKTVQRKRRRVTKKSKPVQLGTGYGKEASFYTETTTFERATETPALTIQVQYAVREMLEKWGVPVHEEPPSPDAFPATASVPPPPGWRASR